MLYDESKEKALMKEFRLRTPNAELMERREKREFRLRMLPTEVEERMERKERKERRETMEKELSWPMHVNLVEGRQHMTAGSQSTVVLVGVDILSLVVCLFCVLLRS